MDLETIINILVWGTMVVVIQGVVLVFLIWMLRKRQVWGLIKFALKGGSLVLKAYSDGSIGILQTTKAIESVKWKERDPQTGRRIELSQPIKAVFHRLKGTSYPVHVCPRTYPTNINILTKEKAQLNVSEINAIAIKQYTQGYADASSFKTVGGFPIDKATLLMLFVVGILMVVLIAINLQGLGAISPQG